MPSTVLLEIRMATLNGSRIAFSFASFCADRQSPTTSYRNPRSACSSATARSRSNQLAKTRCDSFPSSTTATAHARRPRPTQRFHAMPNQQSRAGNGAGKKPPVAIEGSSDGSHHPAYNCGDPSTPGSTLEGRACGDPVRAVRASGFSHPRGRISLGIPSGGRPG